MADGKRQEAVRYRRAADLALDQLQWCVNYLHGIRKSQVARSLAKNRARIIEQYRLDR